MNKPTECDICGNTNYQDKGDGAYRFFDCGVSWWTKEKEFDGDCVNVRKAVSELKAQLRAAASTRSLAGVPLAIRALLVGWKERHAVFYKEGLFSSAEVVRVMIGELEHAYRAAPLPQAVGDVYKDSDKCATCGKYFERHMPMTLDPPYEREVFLCPDGQGYFVKPTAALPPAPAENGETK